MDFDLHFPKSAVLGPISRAPVASEQQSEQQAAVEAPAVAAPQPEAPQAEAVNLPAAALSEVVPEPALELALAPEVPAEAQEVPVLAPEAPVAAPVREPKPKPVKAGPPRKGWWQRQTG